MSETPPEPLPDLEPFDVAVDGARIRGRTGGSGPPLLLLHGYPQTGAMWHPIAADLARDHTLVVPDLRGYGASRCVDGDPADPATMTFRAMAADQVAVMAALGHASYDVVGHDRGARTTHRMALDHPGAVRSVALLDILPTLTVWENFDRWLALRYFHWAFLAQGAGLPERMIGADPQRWLDDAVGALGGAAGMPPASLAEYRRAAADPAVVAAWCGDYRAGATLDVEHDTADLGRTVDVPALVLWGRRGVVGAQTDPLGAWRSWFPAARGRSVDAGHFLVEEAPAPVLCALREHLAT